MSARNPGSTGGGGGVEVYDSASDSSSSLNVTIEGEVSGYPGSIDVQGRVMGKLGVGAEDVIGDRENNIEIRYLMGDFPRPRYNEELSAFLSLARGEISSIPSQASSIFEASEVPSITEISPAADIIEKNLWAGIRGGVIGLGDQRITGQTPVNYEYSMDFEPVRVPVFGDVTISELTQNIPPLTVSIEVVPKEFIQSAVGAVTDAYPSIELEIPPEAFFRPVEVELDLGPCADRFSDINSDIRSLRQDVKAFESPSQTAETIISDVENQVGDILGRPNFRAMSSDVDIDIQSLDPGQIETPRERIQELKSRVQQANIPSPSDVQSARDRITNLRGRVDGIDQDCKEVFRDRLSEVQSVFDGLPDLSHLRGAKQELLDILNNLGAGELVPCSDKFSDIESTISSLESRVESDQLRPGNISSIRSSLEDVNRGLLADVPSDSRCFDKFQSRIRNIRADLKDIEPSFTCADVPRRVRSRVGGFESEVSEFTGRDIRLVNPQRFQTLMNESRSIESMVDNEVRDENPCKQRLLSRVESSRGRLREFWDGVSEDIPCSQEYSSLSESIQELRQNVATTDPLSQPERAAALASEGKRLIQRVRDNVDEDRCMREFVNQIRTSVENLEVTGDRLRIMEEGELDDSERREQFNQLKDNISSTLEGLGEAELPEELPDGVNVPEVPDGS